MAAAIIYNVNWFKVYENVISLGAKQLTFLITIDATRYALIHDDMR